VYVRSTCELYTNFALTPFLDMSLGGPASSAMDNAITSVSNGGVLVVAAAGNENQPAANVSPCRVPSALCASSVQSNGNRSSYANYGAAVDIWAAGDSITSTGITSDTATATASGTSGAAPHVAGLVS
jgi:subtilisin family serine protease